MSRIVPTALAEQDADDIWLHIAEDNPRAADNMIEEINSALRLLADNPSAGRSRKELVANLRSFPVGNYIIFYRPIEDGILVLRFLHGARDLSEFF